MAGTKVVTTWQKRLAALLIVFAVSALVRSGQGQQVLFVDDFESGTLSQWSTFGTSTPLVITNDRNVTVAGTNSALLDAGTDGMRASLSTLVSNKTWKLTYWGYDDLGGQSRWYSYLMNRSISQVFAAGRYSIAFSGQTGEFTGEQVISSKYQGRVLQGVNSGWFNLIDGPNRSQGWHRFDIEFYSREMPYGQNGGIAKFYVDGVLSRAVEDVFNTPLEMIQMSSLGSSAGTNSAKAWFDDYRLVVDQPYITSDPSGVTLTAGNTLNLSVSAVGPDLTYQWRFNGADIPNATDQTYTFGPLTETNSGDYSVLVSNSADAVVSNPAHVVVNSVIQIFSQPQSQYVNVGTPVTLSVSASGPNMLSYQWRFQGTNIAGATESTYTVPVMGTNHVGVYTVEISDGVNPAVVSEEAMLFMNRAPVITIANTNVIVGNSAVLTIHAADDHSTNGVTITDFEDFADGTAQVLFRAPSFSGSTTNYIDTSATNFSVVTTNLPATNNSEKALYVRWDFIGHWLRLTTASAVGKPNPTVAFHQKVRFDLCSDQPLGVVLGIRETGTSAAIGANGGTVGPIQWVGASDWSPTPVFQDLVPHTWTTYEFDLAKHNADEQVFPMTVNADLELASENGKGVLEHIALLNRVSGTHNLFIDNVAVVPTNRLTYSFDSAPAGAQIDRVTGKIRFNPSTPGTYQFTVRVADHLGLFAVKTFTVTASAAAPGKLTITRAGGNVVLTWDGPYILQSSASLEGGFTDVPGAATGYTVPANAAATFYRLRN